MPPITAMGRMMEPSVPSRPRPPAARRRRSNGAPGTCGAAPALGSSSSRGCRWSRRRRRCSARCTSCSPARCTRRRRPARSRRRCCRGCCRGCWRGCWRGRRRGCCRGCCCCWQRCRSCRPSGRSSGLRRGLRRGRVSHRPEPGPEPALVSAVSPPSGGPRPVRPHRAQPTAAASCRKTWTELRVRHRAIPAVHSSDKRWPDWHRARVQERLRRRLTSESFNPTVTGPPRHLPTAGAFFVPVRYSSCDPAKFEQTHKCNFHRCNFQLDWEGGGQLVKSVQGTYHQNPDKIIFSSRFDPFLPSLGGLSPLLGAEPNIGGPAEAEGCKVLLLSLFLGRTSFKAKKVSKYGSSATSLILWRHGEVIVPARAIKFCTDIAQVFIWKYANI